MFLVEQQPDNADAHRGLASVAYDLGQFGIAVVHLEEVARLDPADARPHRLIGLIYKQMGQHGRAEPAYREAMQRGLPAAKSTEVRRELAESLLELGRFADALTVLGEGPATDAAYAAAQASALRGVRRSTEAAELLNRELQRFPQGGPLHRILGQLALEAGDHSVAIRHLERAVELAPFDYPAHLLLSQTYAGANRSEDAKKEAVRAEQLRLDSGANH